MDTNKTLATLDGTTAIAELDRQSLEADMDDAAEEDGYDGPMEVEEAPKSKRQIARDRKAAAELVEKKRAKEEEEAKRAALQLAVPWKLTDDHWRQRSEIDVYFDESGTYPRAYRPRSPEEWREAIKTLAEAVTALSETHPEYQRKTGLYVEEQGDNLLLICAKRWQLLIQVPTKASTTGKRFELKPAPGVDTYQYGGDTVRLAAFAELITNYLPPENRDTLLDICCQYLRQVRIHVNKATWAEEHPELAYLLNDSQR